MQTNTGKRTAKVRTTLTKRVIEALEPTDTSWIAWDDKLPGFGRHKFTRAKKSCYSCNRGKRPGG